MPPLTFLVTSAGNEFMVDLARTFTDALAQAGLDTSLLIDELPVSNHDGALIVVAPHEYFRLFLSGRMAAGGEAFSRRVFLLNVEQPGSVWFESTVSLARRSLGVFDISAEGAAEFRQRGLSAVHTPLGVRTAEPTRHLAPPAGRSIDIAFLGHVSPRRERFLAAHADALGQLNCRLHLVDVARPRQEKTAGYVHGAERARLLGDTKILLNVHSADRGYFEAHRARLALTNGCVLVTETSRHTAPLQEGRHFVSAPLDQLIDRCLALLSAPEQLAAVAGAGVELTAADDTFAATGEVMLDAVSRWRKRASQSGSEEARRAVRNRLREAHDRRRHGQQDWTVESSTSETSPPRVSVVVTVFNYGHFLERCLQSVAAAEPVSGGVELVIVDDGSTDDSVDRARHLLRDVPLATRLVLKQTNTGPADARNLGLRTARGVLALTLDADNWIHPACLVRLASALDDGRHVAAYPMLSRFDEASTDAVGLLSASTWSVTDLVRAPYIDALAMFRRQAILDVGGYSTDLIDHGWFGWEDYDLWLTLAAAGHSCVHVPNVLAWYSVHEGSMLATTNRDCSGLLRHFRRKFRGLCEAHPDLDLQFGAPAHSSAAGWFTSPSSTSLADLPCRDLQREVHSLRASWSWRLTAPLRGMFRLLTGRP